TDEHERDSLHRYIKLSDFRFNGSMVQRFNEAKPMKRVFHHPPEPSNGTKYWRSIGELSDTPEFRQWLEREFPEGTAELNGDEWSRRDFVKLMGASMALAGVGLTSCRRPE